MADIYVPPRYRVHLDARWNATKSVQVEVTLLPSGLFGIQDGRTLRRNEDGQDVEFDQKTGEFVVQEHTGGAIALDAVSLDNISLGIGVPVTAVGNRLTWIMGVTSAPDAAETIAAIETQIHRLLGVLPILAYVRDAAISVSAILVKQNGHVVGWAELLAVNVVINPYKREIIEEELRTFDSWRQTHFMDIPIWWAMVYFARAMRHQRNAGFIDDLYGEIIINRWKAAEAILGTWKVKEIGAAAKKLGLTDDVAAELEWLCNLRHSDDVAHANIYRKKSIEQFKALYEEQEEKVGR